MTLKFFPCNHFLTGLALSTSIKEHKLQYRVAISSVCRIFERGARKFRKFENNKDQNENFPAQNKVHFPAQNYLKTKKRSLLKFSPVFGPKLGEGQKKVFAHRLCAQTLCPSYKGGAMPQFCVLFYVNYTILATQREDLGPMAPPKYAPDCHTVRKISGMSGI